MICPVRVVLQFSGFNVTVEVLHELLQKVRARKRMTKDIHSNDISTLYPRVTGRLILKKTVFFWLLRWRVSRLWVGSTRVYIVCFSPVGFGV